MKAPSSFLSELTAIDHGLRTKFVGKKIVIQPGSLIEKNVRAHESICDKIEIVSLELHQSIFLKQYSGKPIEKYFVISTNGYFRICVEIDKPNLYGKE
jgi:hypothetical protein